MLKPPIPPNEERRLAELHELAVLDTVPEQAYDDLTQIAAGICGTPIGLVSLVDRERQWFKAQQGLDARETPRDLAFCAHAINDPGVLFVVADTTSDARFADNPLVTGNPHIRFYAGAPLVAPSGNAMGTLCVIDTQPRQLEPFQQNALLGLSRQVAALLELRRTTQRLRHQLQERDWYESQLQQYQREIERENAALAAETRTDALTGILNRRALLSEFKRQTALPSALPLAFVLADIDHFKRINDQFGHVEGDRILVTVAQALRETAAPASTVARFGGEEFALLTVAADDDALRYQGETLRAAIAALTPGQAVTASFGATRLQPGESLQAAYLRADKALYVAKHAGRNRVELG